MNDYLMHYGIKGMKWGVRRTPEQLGHIVRSAGNTIKKGAYVIGKSAKKAVEAKRTRSESERKKKGASDMSDEELRTALSRLRMEEEYSNLMARQNDRKTSSAKAFVKKYAYSAASQIAERAVSKAVSKLFEEKEKKFDVSDFDFKDTSRVNSKDLQEAVKWYSNEKTYQKLRSEYKESKKKEE